MDPSLKYAPRLQVQCAPYFRFLHRIWFGPISHPGYNSAEAVEFRLTDHASGIHLHSPYAGNLSSELSRKIQFQTYFGLTVRRSTPEIGGDSEPVMEESAAVAVLLRTPLVLGNLVLILNEYK